MGARRCASRTGGSLLTPAPCCAACHARVCSYAFNLTSSGEQWQFWFSSAANMRAFAADPWKYAPAWGGF